MLGVYLPIGFQCSPSNFTSQVPLATGFGLGSDSRGRCHQAIFPILSRQQRGSASPLWTPDPSGPQLPSGSLPQPHVGLHFPHGVQLPWHWEHDVFLSVWPRWYYSFLPCLVSWVVSSSCACFFTSPSTYEFPSIKLLGTRTLSEIQMFVP